MIIQKQKLLKIKPSKLDDDKFTDSINGKKGKQ